MKKIKEIDEFLGNDSILISEEKDNRKMNVTPFKIIEPLMKKWTEITFWWMVHLKVS